MPTPVRKVSPTLISALAKGATWAAQGLRRRSSAPRRPSRVRTTNLASNCAGAASEPSLSRLARRYSTTSFVASHDVSGAGPAPMCCHAAQRSTSSSRTGAVRSPDCGVSARLELHFRTRRHGFSLLPVCLIDAETVPHRASPALSLFRCAGSPCLLLHRRPAPLAYWQAGTTASATVEQYFTRGFSPVSRVEGGKHHAAVRW